MVTASSSSPRVTSWIDSEPGWLDAKRELRSVGRRVRKRWLLVLLLTCLSAGFVAMLVSGKKRKFESTIVMRLAERDLESDTAPPASGQLQKHISQVALSRHVLLSVAEEFGLYKSQRAADPSWGEQLMRDSIELAVFDNDFESEASDELTRTTRIAISFSGPDPETSLAVVRRLGKFVENSQIEERQRFSAAIARSVGEGVSELHEQFVKLNQQHAELSYKRSVWESPAAVDVALQHLRASILRTENEMNAYAARAEMLRLRRDFERQDRGLRFEIVDPGELPEASLTDRQRAVIYTCCAVLLLMPLIALAVGTFDARARDSDGLRRIGLHPLGEVRAFEGMDCGAWTRRVVAERGGK